MKIHTTTGQIIEADTEAFVAALIELLPPEQFGKFCRRVETQQAEHEAGRIGAVASRIVRAV